MSILSLFLILKTRFVNFVVGYITRDSIRAALKHGITARLICEFLESHTHQMVKSQHRVPPSVVDQIYLWERERNRLTMQDGVLYQDFGSEREWQETEQHARELGIMLWTSSEPTQVRPRDPVVPVPVDKRMLVVTAQGHE